ncbi:hypothetical protein GGQ87_001585 [Brevundimonas alba]|uniref:DUF1176 domain-containing protein n=1 Tax=Brevundimonas alba TaxID=74314 RepID=A0A7X5YKH6_9CAUL|nr:DUF1176 domain-containing protein [Brevundimonas alba]NJC41327.1 hypothetical protein [Brevundimonas alba]
MRRIIGPCLLALALVACGDGDGKAAKAGSASPTPLIAGSMPAASATQASGPTMPSASRKFRDWLAVCDNTNECAAFGPASDQTGWIRVAASPGPNGARSVSLGVWGDTDAKTGAMSVDIDGRRFVARSEQGSDDFRIAPGDAPALIAMIGSGKAMSVGAGDAPRMVSLSGAAAAMLWIDERQGKLQTPAALVGRGTRPVSAIPAPPAPPVVTPAPAVSQAGFGDSGQTLPAALEALPAVRECREEADSDWVRKEVMSARLDASTELWAVPCFSGAYNIGHDWYLTGPGGRNPRPVQLASASGETTTGTINGGYAANARTLVAFAKGRGPGDCGLAQTWTWTGRAFVLSEEHEMTECWGVPPDQWPSTWRTR